MNVVEKQLAGDPSLVSLYTNNKGEAKHSDMLVKITDPEAFENMIGYVTDTFRFTTILIHQKFFLKQLN